MAPRAGEAVGPADPGAGSDAERPKIGVALSGGGHRATTWGLGVLLYLVDAGRNRDVVAISSVSGGSIANGVVAHEVDFAATDPDEFRDRVRPLARHVAHEGLFFFGPSTNRYVRFVLSLATLLAVVTALLVGLGLAVALGTLWPAAAPSAVGTRAVGYAAAVVCGPLAWSLAKVGTRDRVAPDRWLVGGLGAAAVVGAALVAAGWTVWNPTLGVRIAGGWLALAWLVLLVVCLWVFERRSEAADRALARVHFGGAAPTDLAAVPPRAVTHVVCATELQSGDHAYFSPGFVYSYRHGLATPPPAGLRLSTAVQASACLPGAFVPRRLDVTGYGFDRGYLPAGEPPADRPTHLVLTDGGVYDNMADQWFQGHQQRLARIPALAGLAHPPADVLLVANASAGWRWREMRWSPLRSVRELTGLARAKSIMYDATTAHRRYGLVAQFEAATIRGSGLRGGLVHIPQTPYRVARAFARSPDPARRARAAEVLAHLGDAEDAWAAIAQADSEVETVLRALGPATTARLLRHAYALAMCNAHVLFGWGLRPIPTQAELERWIGPP